MLFVVAVLVTYFLTAPGMYLILRSRLATSLAEAVSIGFFLGFGLIVIAYLGLSRCLPLPVCDFSVLLCAFICTILFVREIGKQRLPIWLASRDFWQSVLVLAAVVFMFLLAFGDLVSTLDDDIFIHLSTIKRIAMGDIPPHLPFAPDTLLRGHTGRDIFTGTIARILDLRPELAIVYVTLALCPAYVLSFHSLAARLAEKNRLATCFCFFGMLFIVSFAIGDRSIRAGSITYIWNNNAFAYPYTISFAWLLFCVFDLLYRFKESNYLLILKQALLPIFLLISAYAALYFVYLSNFLMFSVFLVSLPFFVAVASQQDRIRNSLKTLALVSTIFLGAGLLHVFISPFLWERVLTSLGIIHPNEPLTMIQQAQFTFPKPNLFAITSPSGADIPFFNWSSICSQGLSFYLGLSALFFGLFRRRVFMSATSWFGWLILLWLLTVDMGTFRAETLRLMLLAHIAFGASSGLVIGFLLTDVLKYFSDKGKNTNLIRLAAIGSCASICLFMGWGSIDKFISSRHWRVAHNWQLMRKIENKNPEDWNSLLNMCAVDYQIFEALGRSIRDPDQRLLLKMAPDIRFKAEDYPIHSINTIVNASAVSGAAVVGVCQEHSGPHMDVQVFLYDFRSSLFWQEPCESLLSQLAPDWIIIDPQLVSQANLQTIISLPGVSKSLSVQDADGRKRVLLRYQPAKRAVAASGVERVTFLTQPVKTNRFGLAKAVAKIDSPNSGKEIQLKMLVYDMQGKPVNLMDTPLIYARRTDAGNYSIDFSMIQSGRWLIALVDPVSNRELTPNRLPVDVRDTMAIAKFASCPPIVLHETAASNARERIVTHEQ